LIKSESINELFKALSLVQGKIEDATKDGKNPFFNNAKYAKLESYLIEARPLLSEQGLSITQLIETIETKTVLTTILAHSTGQYIGASFELKLDKQSMQGLGSAISYARRYSYAAILSMGSEDDDGNLATNKGNVNEKDGKQNNVGTSNRQIDSGKSNQNEQRLDVGKSESKMSDKSNSKNEHSVAENNPKQPDTGITQKQRTRLFALMKAANWDESQLRQYCKDKLNIDSTKDLHWINYQNLCKILELKKPYDLEINK